MQLLPDTQLTAVQWHLLVSHGSGGVEYKALKTGVASLWRKCLTLL